MKELSKSLEKYLITIYELIEENSAARVRDVAIKLNIGAASTSEAIKNLARKGFINYQPYGIITITEKGKQTVVKKINRHKIIQKFLDEVLMLDKNKLEDYTSDIEFSMPDEILTRFVDYLEFIQKCSCKEPKWVKSFQYYVKNGKMQTKCKNCTADKLNDCNCHGCK